MARESRDPIWEADQRWLTEHPRKPKTDPIWESDQKWLAETKGGKR